MNQLDSKRFDFLMDSYPYARSSAKVLLEFTKTSNLAQLDIMQINSFPGLFTKNLLLSLKDLNAQLAINYCTHESDETNLSQLKSVLNFTSSNLHHKFTNESLNLLISSSNTQVAILNNINSTNTNLELILKDLSHSQKIKLIIGSESKKNQMEEPSELEGYKLKYLKTNYLLHYIYLKNDLDFQRITKIFTEEFEVDNAYEKYFDLIKSLKCFSSPQSVEYSKFLLDELMKLDGFSANSYFLIGKYLKVMGDSSKAEEYFQKARQRDPYNQLTKKSR
jgi:tetratricopeptide (TPR) repeat protein